MDARMIEQHVKAVERDGFTVIPDAIEPELVADLRYPEFLLRDQFLGLAMSQDAQFDLATALAPGQIGAGWIITSSAFALGALSTILSARVQRYRDGSPLPDRAETALLDYLSSPNIGQACVGHLMEHAVVVAIDVM